MKIHLLPIEPLEERYSAQWLHWFPPKLEELGCEVHTVMGAPTQLAIKQGQFLDVVDTNVFKATQLAAFAHDLQRGAVRDGDWVLLLDAWNPAVLQLAYMRDLGAVKFKIAACWHAGSYDPWDLLGQHPTMKDWARYAETSMLAAADLSFVATHAHASMLEGARATDTGSIRVTGFPLYAEDWSRRYELWGARSRRVVFPHRLAPEKDPVFFDMVRSAYGEAYPDDQAVEWIKTKEVCTTKSDYYHMIGGSRVAFSSALQETWGIAMLEAASLGAHPVVPDRLSYREIFGSCYRDVEHAVAQVRAGLEAREPYQLDTHRWTHAIRNMVACMEELDDHAATPSR